MGCGATKPNVDVAARADALISMAPKLERFVTLAKGEAADVDELHALLAEVYANRSSTEWGRHYRWRGRPLQWVCGADVAMAAELVRIGPALVGAKNVEMSPWFLSAVEHAHGPDSAMPFLDWINAKRLRSAAGELSAAYPQFAAFFDSVVSAPYDVSYYERLEICVQMMDLRTHPDSLAHYVSCVREEHYRWCLAYIDRMRTLPTWHPRMIDPELAPCLNKLPDTCHYLHTAVKASLALKRIAAAGKSVPDLPVATADLALILPATPVALATAAPGGPLACG